MGATEEVVTKLSINQIIPVLLNFTRLNFKIRRNKVQDDESKYLTLLKGLNKKEKILRITGLVNVSFKSRWVVSEEPRRVKAVRVGRLVQTQRSVYVSGLFSVPSPLMQSRPQAHSV